MEITARLVNSADGNKVHVSTNGNEKSMAIPAKPDGKGSAINGGELLLTAIATCYCNDIYREASRRQITITSISVSAKATFGGEGEPAKSISYSVSIDSPNSKDEINKLIKDVDPVAEIHNTLRQGIAVTLEQ